jgi:hypothetical protein
MATSGLRSSVRCRLLNRVDHEQFDRPRAGRASTRLFLKGGKIEGSLDRCGAMLNDENISVNPNMPARPVWSTTAVNTGGLGRIERATPVAQPHPEVVSPPDHTARSHGCGLLPPHSASSMRRRSGFPSARHDHSVDRTFRTSMCTFSEPFRQHLSHHRPHLRRRRRSFGSRIYLKTARGRPSWSARHLQGLHIVCVLDQLSQRSAARANRPWDCRAPGIRALAIPASDLIETTSNARTVALPVGNSCAAKAALNHRIAIMAAAAQCM